MQATRKSNPQTSPTLSSLPEPPEFPDVQPYSKDYEARLRDYNRASQEWWRKVVKMLAESQQDATSRISSLEAASSQS